MYVLFTQKKTLEGNHFLVCSGYQRVCVDKYVAYIMQFGQELRRSGAIRVKSLLLSVDILQASIVSDLS